MNEIINAIPIQVYLSNDVPVVTSRNVAEYFHKRHNNVLRDIDNLVSELNSMGVCSKLSRPMFKEITYRHSQNEQLYREFEINRDGFTLLAMGFTGKEALRWKLEYIEAFNKMERYITSGIDPTTVPPAKLPRKKSSKKELPSINRHSEAVIKALGVLLSQGYTTQPYIHNTVPKEPFLGFDEDTHVYIPSKLVYDTYKQIAVNCLDLTNLCRVLAEDRIINNDEKRWIRNYNGDAGYTYVRNAAGHKYRTLRFCKESIYPRLLKDINAGNIPELYQ